MGLGVSSRFVRGKNLEIISRKHEQNPSLTRIQVNYLSRFTWVGHKKGLNYPECRCLRCEGLHIISTSCRQIIEDFLSNAIMNKLLYDRSPSEEEWANLIKKLEDEGYITKKRKT